MGTTSDPARGKGTGHECQFRAPSSEASGVLPFAITWQVFSLNF